jgi:mRNA interferase YafQ
MEGIGNMKYQPVYSSRLKRQLKATQKRGYNMQLFKDIVTKLANGEKLEAHNNDHALYGNWKGFRECHILPDWLLIYKIDGIHLILYLERTGTHSDLLE